MIILNTDVTLFVILYLLFMSAITGTYFMEVKLGIL